MGGERKNFSIGFKNCTIDTAMLDYKYVTTENQTPIQAEHLKRTVTYLCPSLWSHSSYSDNVILNSYAFL